MEKFKSTDVCKILDIPKKRFNQYLERKQIKPSIPAGGSGYRNEFTSGDLLKIRLFQKLIEHGHTLAGASQIAFSQESKPLIESLERAGSEWMAFMEKQREGSWTTMAGPFGICRKAKRPLGILEEAHYRPEHVVWAFYKDKAGTKAQMLGEFDNTNASDALNGHDIVLIIDFSVIAKEVIGLIETAKGK